MATKKKLDLFDVLKFTPQTYKIRMYGYGGEVVMGTVDKKVYNYFQDNEINLSDFVYDWDNEQEIPEEFLPFNPGSWYECDNIIHENGVEMNDACMVEVEDENGKIIWQSSLSLDDLENHGATTTSIGEYYASEQPPGTVVFYGQSFEKGSFWDGELELTQPFDPSMLSFSYVDVEGWIVNCGIDYEDEELYSDDYSTTGKSSSFEFIVNEDVDYQTPHETGTDNPIDFPNMPEVPKTEWYPVNIKPVRVGLYECQLNKIATWPWPNEAMLEWTGKKWLDTDGKIIKPQTWRGLTEETQ